MNNQIEEMARILCESTANKANCDKCGFHRHCSKFYDATNLYDANYRKQEWISVDERLPKQWETVLVCCDDIISTDFISSNGRWYEHIDHDSVTHWMPLPEPPKGE